MKREKHSFKLNSVDKGDIDFILTDLLTLGVNTQEGYSSCPVCVHVCMCMCVCECVCVVSVYVCVSVCMCS